MEAEGQDGDMTEEDNPAGCEGGVRGNGSPSSSPESPGISQPPAALQLSDKLAAEDERALL